MDKKEIIPLRNQEGQLDLEVILRLSQKHLKESLAYELKMQGYQVVNKNGFLYAAGEIPVLLMAHMDTVHRDRVKEIFYTRDGRSAMSPQGIGGDDRAGVYMLLKIIEQAKCFVLFCEDEEIGCIGAQKFTKSKYRPEINYIVEMDRRGANDAVFYDCDNPEFTQYICSFGFEEAYGSCSDISFVAPHLGVAAVNISSGYYNEHRPIETIRLDQMELNARRICEMVQKPSAYFRYKKRRSSRWFCSGDYEQQMLWDFMEQPKPDERISLMPLPEDCILLVNGQKVSRSSQHYMDRKGNVYGYLPELDAAVLYENTEAQDQYGKLLFRSEGSRKARVISIEEAMELLKVV